jgi:hypothetical protein
MQATVGARKARRQQQEATDTDQNYDIGGNRKKTQQLSLRSACGLVARHSNRTSRGRKKTQEADARQGTKSRDPPSNQQNSSQLLNVLTAVTACAASWPIRKFNLRHMTTAVQRPTIFLKIVV